ncbi:MAG: flotillin family protein [Actinobacteria bacterium]|nr:flotillin family protein [Actinomycetota bacterium]
MSGLLTAVGVVIVIVAVVAIGFGLLVTRLFRKVPQGQALVVSKWKEVVVTFTGQVVIPVIHKAEVMDISVKNIQVDRRGKDGLVCKDNVRADISVDFYVKVDKTEEAVIRVAQQVGTVRASDLNTLRELFAAKFSEALKSAGKEFDFEDLYTSRQQFKDVIIGIIGQDLNGYVLEDVAIDYLEQTAIEELDPTNILDADGIRKITERTVEQHIRTNDAQEREREETTRRTTDADKAVFEMDRDRAEALARQQQEIRTVQARSDAEAKQVEAEAVRIAEEARIAAEEGVGVADQNKDREIALADANRQRVIAVQTEEIERDRALAEVGRETAVAEAAKEKETSERALAELTRGRVEADLGVAEKEEEIATLRVVEEAQRQATSEVKQAEGLAEAAFIARVKEADAAKQAAGSEAERLTTLARAEADAASQEMQASKRRAEGTQAVSAAEGLAEVQVERERADAIRATGLAEVEVKKADAEALREVGMAEGDATKARLEGEGEGLKAKSEGVGAMTAAGQDHEEFRLRLDVNREVELAAISAKADVAKSAAAALGESLSNADMTIVSDEGIVERILSAAGHGQAIDGFVGSSDAGRRMLRPYLEGDSNLISDVADGLGGIGAAGIRDLTIADLVSRIGGRLGSGGNDLVATLREAIEAGGLGDRPVGELLDGDDR